MSQDNIDINVYKTIEEVTIDVQPNLTVVNVNSISGGLPVTKTSELINDGENGVDPFITLEDIPPIDISTLVPYTGATQDVDLGENGISTGFVKFDTTPTDIPELQGAMFWDEDDNTVDVILNGYRMKIGEDTFYPVKNQSGSTITKGTNVKFAGTVGASGRLLILPFLANGTDPSYVYMGVTAEDIADGEDGKVLWFGRLRGLNTNAFNEGDILYASTTSAGGFQTAIPTGANNIVQVSAVITKSTTQGVIFIRPQIEPVLFKPENVANKAINLTSPDDVKYPTTLAVSTALSGKQDTLTNPVTGTGANGQVSFWNGANSQTGDNGLFWDNTNKRLGIGTNAPDFKLKVESSVANYDGIIYKNTNANGIAAISISGSASPSVANDLSIFVGSPSQSIRNTYGFSGNFADLTAATANGFGMGTYNNAPFIIGTANTAGFRMFGSTRNIVLQNGGTFTDAGFRLDVNGTARISGRITATGGLVWGNAPADSYLETGGAGTKALSINRRFISISNGADNELTIDAGNGAGAITKIFVAGGGGTQPICINGNGRETVFGLNTATPNASSLIRMESTTKGFLPPRMTTVQKNAIATPAAGLVVYDTTDNKHYGYDGTTWNAFY
jgi:hypothetical protein